MNCTYILHINAPIAKVFSLVDEEKNLKKWIDGLEETVFPEGYDRAKTVGTKFKQRIKEGSRINEYDGEVIAYEKPSHLGILLGNKHFTVKVDYRFTTDGVQTRLDYQAEIIRAGWFVRFMGKLFSGFSKRLLDRQMKKLKELAESSSDPFGTATRMVTAAN
jgi:carbon monoxide dehydrogenase subunit G